MQGYLVDVVVDVGLYVILPMILHSHPLHLFPVHRPLEEVSDLSSVIRSCSDPKPSDLCIII